jgi:hypothetical protein
VIELGVTLSTHPAKQSVTDHEIHVSAASLLYCPAMQASQDKIGNVSVLAGA